MRRSYWTHKKTGKTTFKGTYQFHRGDRSFVLVSDKTGREISFESHEAAKKLGWVKR